MSELKRYEVTVEVTVHETIGVYAESRREAIQMVEAGEGWRVTSAEEHRTTLGAERVNGPS